MWRNRQGQSTVEYAVLAAVVVGALLAMQIYLKRGTMGKLRESSDQIGDQFTPLSTVSSFETVRDVTRNEVTVPSGLVTSSITGQEKQGRTGSEEVQAKLDEEKLF